jgi:hypothetical protein
MELFSSWTALQKPHKEGELSEEIQVIKTSAEVLCFAFAEVLLLLKFCPVPSE